MKPLLSRNHTPDSENSPRVAGVSHGRRTRAAGAITLASLFLLVGVAAAPASATTNAPASATTNAPAPATPGTPATLTQVQEFYLDNIRQFEDSLKRKQGIKITSTGTEYGSYKDTGIVNKNGTMKLTRRLYGDIQKAYTCPKRKKCYGKKGGFIWKKVPVSEAKREADFWTTQVSTLMFFNEVAGTYTISDNAFTYDYVNDLAGLRKQGTFRFLPNGYRIDETYSYTKNPDTTYTNTTRVKKVRAKKVRYNPNAR